MSVAASMFDSAASHARHDCGRRVKIATPLRMHTLYDGSSLSLGLYLAVVVVSHPRIWFCFISCDPSVFPVVGHDLFPVIPQFPLEVLNTPKSGQPPKEFD